MQFPVPQFTDVEDKIIGPLTIKQFGIVFGAGVIVFLGYSASKSILVLIFLALLFGVPALAMAFAKINGRPIYNSLGFYVKFAMSPKILIFHKEAVSSKSANLKDAQLTQPAKPEIVRVSTEDTQSNLRKIQELLSKTEVEEKDAAGKFK